MTTGANHSVPRGLRGRIALFFTVRYATPLLVLLALAAGSTEPAPDATAWILSLQVTLALATHVLAARAPALSSVAIWVGMIADTIAIGTLIALTGGTAGPLVFLFTVQALAAGILLSSRAGARVIALGSAAIVTVDLAASPAQAADALLPSGAVAIAALWVLGGAAAAFTSYNERELRRRNAELAAVRSITLDIERSLSLEEIFTHLCAGVAESFGFDVTAVLLREGDGMRCAGAHGVSDVVGAALPMGERTAAALAAGEPVVAGRDVGDDSMRAIVGARGYVAVPIADDGVLVVTRSGRNGAPGSVRASEIETLESVAHHARLAVANARLHADVARMAITDPLTGLWNHGEMQRKLTEEAGRLGRYTALRGNDHALSFVLMDIDHFKKFNDTYGHPAGDAVLKQVARNIRGAVRNFDVVARYGGEEFAVILPETGVEGAREVAERVRQAVAGAPFDLGDGRTVRVTVSVGIATAGSDASPADLIEKADAALYRSKHAGRNRVTHTRDPRDPEAKVVAMEPTRRRRERVERLARDASQRAPERSSRPRRRIPRA